MSEEIWKPVVGYEGLYEVSNHGRLQSWRYGKHRYLKLKVSRGGYLQVHLTKNKFEKTCYVHRVVWRTFVGEIPEGKWINHLDGVPANNRLDNLEVVTRRENMCHAFGKKNPYTGTSARANGRWAAQIKNKGIYKHLGTFNTREEAYNAYLDAIADLGEENKYAQRRN